jgi:hypothetical protein
MHVRATSAIESCLPRRVWVRWLLLPIVTIGGCGATSMLGTGAEDFLRNLRGSNGVEFVLPLDARYAFWYGAQAFVFVVAGSIMAPRWRPAVAVLLFAIGAYLANTFLGSWYFPELHPRGYEPSRLPLEGCLAGGVLGVVAIWWATRRRALTTAGAAAQ